MLKDSFNKWTDNHKFAKTFQGPSWVHFISSNSTVVILLINDFPILIHDYSQFYSSHHFSSYNLRSQSVHQLGNCLHHTRLTLLPKITIKQKKRPRLVQLKYSSTWIQCDQIWRNFAALVLLSLCNYYESLNNIWQKFWFTLAILNATGQIFNAVNGQTLKNNLAILSHWLLWRSYSDISIWTNQT